MTPWHRSIRTRIAAALALVAIVAALVLGLIVDRSTMIDGRARLRAQALDELAVATASYDFTGTLLPDVTTGPGAAPPQVMRAVTADDAVTWFDGKDMWAAREVGRDSVLALRMSAADLLRQRTDLRRTLIIATVLVAALASLTGWFVAGSLTLRLRRAARRFEPEGGDRDEVTGDEVGELVGRIEQLTGSLAARLERERAFSADVAHELRTPMTALVSATELLPDDQSSRLVRRQTVRLRRLVEELLELSRAEGVTDLRRSPTDLGDVVRRLVRESYDDVTVEVDRAAVMETDPVVLERVIGNLLANATRHGRPPVVVTVEGARVVVEDHGPGFPDEVIAEGPRRFAARGETAGSGLGLSIAAAWAERLGGRLELTNTDDGARAVLDLRS